MIVQTPEARIALHSRLASYHLTAAEKHPEGSDRREAREWLAEEEFRFVDAIQADQARAWR